MTDVELDIDNVTGGLFFLLINITVQHSDFSVCGVGCSIMYSSNFTLTYHQIVSFRT